MIFDQHGNFGAASELPTCNIRLDNWLKAFLACNGSEEPVVLPRPVTTRQRDPWAGVHGDSDSETWWLKIQKNLQTSDVSGCFESF